MTQSWPKPCYGPGTLAWALATKGQHSLLWDEQLVALEKLTPPATRLFSEGPAPLYHVLFASVWVGSPGESRICGSWCLHLHGGKH